MLVSSERSSDQARAAASSLLAPAPLLSRPMPLEACLRGRRPPPARLRRVCESPRLCHPSLRPDPKSGARSPDLPRSPAESPGPLPPGNFKERRGGTSLQIRITFSNPSREETKSKHLVNISAFAFVFSFFALFCTFHILIFIFTFRTGAQAP